MSRSLRGALVTVSLIILVSIATPAAGQGSSRASAPADWADSVRLSDQEGRSWFAVVAVVGATVHVVWHDESPGNYEILYRRSEDGGTTWLPQQRLSTSPGWSQSPSIAVDGSDVHLVWMDDSFGDWQVVYKKSADGGMTWSPYRRLSWSPGSAFYPELALSGDTVHLVWMDDSFGSYDIVYKRSDDAGDTWSDFQRVSRTPEGSLDPAIAVTGGEVHVVWSEYSFGNFEIVHKRSDDGGNTWSPYRRLSSTAQRSDRPAVAMGGGVTHVAWQEHSFGDAQNYEIVYKNSPDGGATWSTFHQFTISPRYSLGPEFAVSGQDVYVVWSDHSFGHAGAPPFDNGEIVLKHSADNGTSWSSYERVSFSPRTSSWPSIAVSDGDIHVVWHDSSFGAVWNDDDIVYKRTLGP